MEKAGTYNPSKVPTHALIEMGRKGQKSNAGWFDYKDNRTPIPSKKVTAMLRNMFPSKGGQLTQEEITLSLFMPMINEGFKILEEGMAQKPSDIDVCYVYGYNFPKVRGGPMFYADAIGLPTVKKTLEKLSIQPAKTTGRLHRCKHVFDRLLAQTRWQTVGCSERSNSSFKKEAKQNVTLCRTFRLFCTRTPLFIRLITIVKFLMQHLNNRIQN